MLKYIVKRLLISIIILLGVSVIIYTLVRLMPNDYVDTKFSSQLSQGKITQDDIDNFKKLYGLYNPEAELKITIDDYEGQDEGQFVRDVKIHNYENGTEANNVYADFVVGSYRNGTDTLTLKVENGNLTYTIKRVEYVKVINGDSETHVQKKTDLDKGTFTVNVDKNHDTGVVNSQSINLVSDTKGSLSTSVEYKVASFWKRLAAILGGYFTWLGNLAKGDLGTSFMYEKPVAQVISENMWISFAIALVATILQFIIAIPLGVSGATHQYSAQDYIVTIFTMIGLSLPTYFFAAIMIKVFAVDLGWLPTSGLVDSKTFTSDFAKFGNIAKHLILPISVSVVLSLGGLMRYTRTNTLEVLNADYIRTARAKGLSEKTVVYKHAFRNTLIPLATLLAGILPSLFGGMMITEQVFAIDGIGNLAYKALKGGDIPFIMGYNMFLAILTVIGTLLSDIMYAVVDPRVKLGK